MLDDKTIAEIAFNLSCNTKDYMKSFRENLFRFGATDKLTLDETAEIAGISVNTLNSLLYKGAQDCKLSTAIALARVFGISVDELVGCGTLVPAQRESMAMLRMMPKFFNIWIRWVIRKNFDLKKEGQVIIPKCNVEYIETYRKEVLTNDD